MTKKITRRDFLATATAATAATCAGDPFAAFAREDGRKPLQSTLLPARSGALFNVARNRVVYQSNSVDDDHAGHLATDGSELTWWEGKPQEEQWILVDLGRVYPIDRLTVHWHCPRASIRIEISKEDAEPSQWTTAYATSDAGPSVEQVPLKGVIARYIRVTGRAREAGRGLAISELEVWSSNGPATSPDRYEVCSRAGKALAEGWSLQCALFTGNDARAISSPEYSGNDWIPAEASATVLTSYVATGAIPDPFSGNQVTQISDGFFSKSDFWYRNSFAVSPDCRGRKLWLVFEGINWKADVYFNGARLGSIDGAFIRGRFDITQLAVCGGMNCVAVLIHPVAHPGPVQHKKLGEEYRNGGVLGLDSPTFLSSIGWNWLPTIPGRNIGIWNEVRFETTDQVLLIDPWVTTELPVTDPSRAHLTARAELKNISQKAKPCALILSMGTIRFRQTLDLQPYETRSIIIDPASWAALSIENPRLWWPNGYGDPVLHSMKFQVECDGKISDEGVVSFGIRTLGYQTDGGMLRILVNGHPILCRGGNWGMDDGMLRCDDQGYDLRVQMHREAHLNMIRNWVGMVGRSGFYDACDRHGILIWDDFWLANPVDGPDPSDRAMFLSNAVDKVRRVRHHASLALYCGRNEGLPPSEIDAGLRNAVSELDGTRFYIPASDRGLVTGHGPYDDRDPEWYFAHRGGTFHSEQGIVCVPPVESMRAMMPERDLWPISDTWAVHDYQNPRSVLYTERISSRYGKAEGIEDYCRKAQMINLESAKAMYECLRSRRGGGQLVWMTQSAWPALICQLYDYYFEQTAAYFGAKSACEPIHIFWDQSSDLVRAANDTRLDCRRLQADAWMYDLDGQQSWHKAAVIDVPAGSAQDCFPLSGLDRVDRVFFVRLRLSEGRAVLSENFYWSPAKAGDGKALNKLPQISLIASANRVSQEETHSVTVTVSNPTPSVALAIRLKLIHGRSGARVLPALYEDNYFSLLPGADRTVAIRFPNHALAGESLRLVVTGWNIREQIHECDAAR